jgi:hypothetical protein
MARSLKPYLLGTVRTAYPFRAPVLNVGPVLKSAQGTVIEVAPGAKNVKIGGFIIDGAKVGVEVGAGANVEIGELVGLNCETLLVTHEGANVVLGANIRPDTSTSEKD